MTAFYDILLLPHYPAEGFFVFFLLCPVEGQVMDGILHDGAGLRHGGIHVPVKQGGIKRKLDLVKLLYPAALAVH